MASDDPTTTAHTSLHFDHDAGTVTVTIRRPLTKAEALDLATSLRWFAMSGLAADERAEHLS